VGGSSRREVWTRERLEPYREAFSQPGAARAAIDYYRAAARLARVSSPAACALPASDLDSDVAVVARAEDWRRR